MSASISSSRLPSALAAKVRSVRWRHALLALIRGLAMAWCVMIGLMILAMAVDWAFPFMDSNLRVMMTTVTVLAAAFVLIVFGVKPVREALGWQRAAKAIDGEIPQLEERWSTVASISKRDPSLQNPVERAMAAQVTSEAIAMERIVQPTRITPPVSPRAALTLALAFGMVLFAIVLASPSQAWVLLQRFWSPTSTLTASRLISVTGDRVVPRGAKIDLETRLEGLPRSTAVLTVREVKNNVQQSYFVRPSDGDSSRFLHLLRVDDSVAYRFRAGDGQTPWHTLRAIDYPEVAEVQFTVDFS